MAVPWRSSWFGGILRALVNSHARRMVLPAIDDFPEDAWGSSTSRQALRGDVLAHFHELQMEAESQERNRWR